MLDVFPQNLQEYDASGQATSNTLGDLPGFGRIHGFIKDPFNRYVNANFFAPGGGYIGIIDTMTKEAVALFRVTEFSSGRSVHMSTWATDGSAIIVANLNGKAIERINVYRNSENQIVRLEFDRSAVLGLGTDMTVQSEATRTLFRGSSAFGNQVLGDIVGDYTDADLGNLTPRARKIVTQDLMGKWGSCQHRACPIVSSNDNAYITMGGGGILIANIKTTPMQITGEYGQNDVYGAGCGGQQTGNTMFLDPGVSASPAGATLSTFAVFAFDDTGYAVGSNNAQNLPSIKTVYEDDTTRIHWRCVCG